MTQQKGKPPIRILLADDHQMIKQSLSLWLSDQPNITLVEMLSSGKEVIAFLEEQPHAVDIVLMDLFMEEPDRTEPAGLKTAQYIFEDINYREIRKIKVILFSGKDRGLYMAKAYLMGVDAFLHKKHDTEELLEAIQTVMNGELYYNLEVRAKIDAYLSNNTLPMKPIHLTEMEKKVLHLLSEGYSAKMMAAHLGSAKGTVETHKKHLIKKLNAYNAPHAVSIAYRRGLLEVE